MTLVPRDVLAPFRAPRGVPPAEPLATEGGGGTTLVASSAPLPRSLLAFTAGGGGTTSVLPKILPIKLLINDPLPDCVGGGGTTVFEGSGTLPLARRRISCETSVEGGGAMTDGVGKVSLELRWLTRSGADAGGGTTATFAICTGELEIWRLTPPGAGGITLAASAGTGRPWSCVRLGAGAITLELSAGRVSRCSCETLGAGGITLGASAGATRACCATFGAGGITSTFSLGATSGWSREKLGVGGTTALSAMPLRV